MLVSQKQEMEPGVSNFTRILKNLIKRTNSIVVNYTYFTISLFFFYFIEV